MKRWLRYAAATDRGGEAVPRALLYRHFKRVAAHVMNVLSAVVMPVDGLDSYDGPRKSRI